MTGAILDSTTGLLTITSSQYADLKTLSFNIGDTTYNLIPNAQIWPRSLNSAVGGTSSSIYLVVNDIGLPDGLAFDFINGYTFLYVPISYSHVQVFIYPRTGNGSTVSLIPLVNALELPTRFTRIPTRIKIVDTHAESVSSCGLPNPQNGWYM